MPDGRPIIIPDPKIERPQTLKEARQLIADTFGAQGKSGWDANDRCFYLDSLGIENTVENLNIEEARTVIEDLDNLKLILFWK